MVQSSLVPALGRAEVLPELPPVSTKFEIPIPYWVDESKLAMRAALERTSLVDLETLVWASLAHSPWVQSVQTVPLIRETEIEQAAGVFDPNRFISSIWNDLSDPVGNTLATGGPSRLNEHLLESKGGVRAKNPYGGNWEIGQELSLRDNNSIFLSPRQQADSRMIMRYTQPLMRGYGQAYNRATISVAQINFDASNHDAHQSIQSHIYELTVTYWDLVRHRAVAIQIHRGIGRLQKIHQQLENRADLDLIKNQLLRAEAAVHGLQARYARVLAEILRGEERLRQMVNAPWLQSDRCEEIVPNHEPFYASLPIQLESELDQALMNRPDLLAIRDQLRAAQVRLRVAQEDLRPTLNLVTDVYVRGLNGNYDVANSFADQFATGAPSYSGGVEYLRPKNQTLAHAIRRQRDLEIRQLLFDLEDRLLQVRTEVRTSIALLQASHTELAASISGTMASQSEVEYLDARWQSATFLEPTQVSLTLEQLLDAEQRLIQAESSWANAQSDYLSAIARLRWSVGSILSLTPASLLDGSGAAPQ